MLFSANAFAVLVLSVSFTTYLMGLEGGSRMHNVAFETVLLAFFISALVRELLQLFLEGMQDYFSQKWNTFEISSSILFIIGYGFHMTNNEARHTIAVP